MSHIPGSSYNSQNHLCFLRHPTKLLRRTQSHIIGHHSSSSSLPVDDEHLGLGVENPFSLAGAFLRRWQSSRESHSSGADHHRPQSYKPHHPHYSSHHHHHHHHHHHNHHGVRPWRRWASCKERPVHAEHSLASVELAGWASRAATRRGSSLPLPFCSGLSPVQVARKAETLEGVQAAIIKLFQRSPLKENELGTLQESVRALADAEAGTLIYEYYKDQLLKKGMVILREKIKNEQGVELMEQLGETWDYFFTQILPSLQALMYPLAESSKDSIDIRNTTLLEFRNIVVLKVGLKEAIDSKKYEVPVNIRQMLLVLQGLHDPTFLSKEQLDLEKLVACVVVPFLGSRGFYEGGSEPVTKANFRPSIPHLPRNKPRITITVSDASEDEQVRSPRGFRPDQHPIASPSAMRKLHETASSQSMLSHRLKPVMEVLDVGRRHSIVGT